MAGQTHFPITDTWPRWRRMLSETSIVFVLGLIAGGVALIGASLAKHGGLRDFLFGVGASVIASATFFLLQDLSTSPRTREEVASAVGTSLHDLLVPLEQKVDSVGAGIPEQIAALIAQRELFFPDAIYRPANDPDPGYNSDLKADLTGSRTFDFWGHTARFPAQRLAQAHQPRGADRKAVRLILLRPSLESIHWRAARRIQAQGYGADLQSAMRYVAYDIFFGLVALFEVRGLADIAVLLRGNAGQPRIEIFDNTSYITATGYVRPNCPDDLTFRYPLSMRFRSPTLPDYLARRDFEHLWDPSLVTPLPSRMRLGEYEEYLVDELRMLELFRELEMGDDTPSVESLRADFAASVAQKNA